jgi:hypothetical protein
VGGMHYLAYSFFPESTTSVNKTVALVCQLIGGGLVLFSIDSNLGIIRKTRLFKAFFAYLKRFPPINHPKSVSVTYNFDTCVSVSNKPPIKTKPTTLEGKLEYLQDQIDELREKHESSLVELKKENQKHIENLRQQIIKTQGSVTLLEKNLDKISVGGASVQIFGIFLVIYGAIIGYIA